MRHEFGVAKGLGNVVMSKHALERAESQHISCELIEEVLARGIDVPDGFDTVWREWKNVRLVIAVPDELDADYVVKTAFHVKAQAVLGK